MKRNVGFRTRYIGNEVEDTLYGSRDMIKLEADLGVNKATKLTNNPMMLDAACTCRTRRCSSSWRDDAVDMAGCQS
jgi:hypothetical protein